MTRLRLYRLEFGIWSRSFWIKIRILNFKPSSLPFIRTEQTIQSHSRTEKRIAQTAQKQTFYSGSCQELIRYVKQNKINPKFKKGE